MRSMVFLGALALLTACLGPSSSSEKSFKLQDLDPFPTVPRSDSRADLLEGSPSRFWEQRLAQATLLCENPRSANLNAPNLLWNRALVSSAGNLQVKSFRNSQGVLLNNLRHLQYDETYGLNFVASYIDADEASLARTRSALYQVEDFHSRQTQLQLLSYLPADRFDRSSAAQRLPRFFATQYLLDNAYWGNRLKPDAELDGKHYRLSAYESDDEVSLEIPLFGPRTHVPVAADQGAIYLQSYSDDDDQRLKIERLYWDLEADQWALIDVVEDQQSDVIFAAHSDWSARLLYWTRAKEQGDWALYSTAQSDKPLWVSESVLPVFAAADGASWFVAEAGESVLSLIDDQGSLLQVIPYPVELQGAELLSLRRLQLLDVFVLSFEQENQRTRAYFLALDDNGQWMWRGPASAQSCSRPVVFF